MKIEKIDLGLAVFVIYVTGLFFCLLVLATIKIGKLAGIVTSPGFGIIVFLVVVFILYNVALVLNRRRYEL
jgi:hypothetical protein